MTIHVNHFTVSLPTPDPRPLHGCSPSPIHSTPEPVADVEVRFKASGADLDRLLAMLRREMGQEERRGGGRPALPARGACRCPTGNSLACGADGACMVCGGRVEW